MYAHVLGEVLLREPSGLALNAGRVVAGQASCQPRWRELVRQAAQSEAGAMLFERAGRAPLTALATALRHVPTAGGAVLVLVRDPEQQAASQRLLRDLFGLAASEASVAAMVADGLAPEQIAQRLSIGRGTVRSHLRQVRVKTGTHRQSELAALIVRSAAMLG